MRTVRFDFDFDNNLDNSLGVRRCAAHGTVISSDCGRFDGVCGPCEYPEHYEHDLRMATVVRLTELEAARMSQTVCASLYWERLANVTAALDRTCAWEPLRAGWYGPSQQDELPF